jgi:hypothetical protein
VVVVFLAAPAAELFESVVPWRDELVEVFGARVLFGVAVDVLLLLVVEPVERVDVLVDEVVFDACVLFARVLADFAVFRLVLRVVRLVGAFVSCC